MHIKHGLLNNEFDCFDLYFYSLPKNKKLKTPRRMFLVIRMRKGARSLKAVQKKRNNMKKV